MIEASGSTALALRNVRAVRTQLSTHSWQALEAWAPRSLQTLPQALLKLRRLGGARCLGAAIVEPAMPGVDALFLHGVGHRLAREGNALYDLRVRPDGRVAFIEASTWDIEGGADPDTWRYRLDLSGPSSTETVTRSRAAVLHFRLNGDPRTPWRGLSPVGLGRYNGEVERRARESH